MKPFANPYLVPPKRTTTALNLDLGTDDYMLLKCIRPRQGTLSTTITLLFNKVCNELRKRNITSIDGCVVFEQFVANCELVLPTGLAEGGLPNSPTQGPGESATGRNDVRRTAQPRVVSKADAPVVPDVQVRNGKRTVKNGKGTKGKPQV